MRRLATTRSLLYFLEEIEYMEAGLAADPDANALAPAISDAIAEWETHFKRERDARREVVRAEAQVAVRNQHIDRTTIQFAGVIRALAPAFMDKVFKVAPNVFVRANLRKQCESTKTVLVPEVASLEATHPLKPFGVTLETLANQTLAALDARITRKGALQLAANEVLEWKEGINNLRTHTYAELLKIAATKAYPRSWVESFFRSAESNEDDASAESNAGSPPSPAPSP